MVVPLAQGCALQRHAGQGQCIDQSTVWGIDVLCQHSTSHFNLSRQWMEWSSLGLEGCLDQVSSEKSLLNQAVLFYCLLSELWLGLSVCMTLPYWWSLVTIFERGKEIQIGRDSCSTPPLLMELTPCRWGLGALNPDLLTWQCVHLTRCATTHALRRLSLQLTISLRSALYYCVSVLEKLPSWFLVPVQPVHGHYKAFQSFIAGMKP